MPKRPSHLGNPGFVKNVKPTDKDKIFMSVVEWCGHDSRGNPTIRIHEDGRKELLDDTPKVVEAFRNLVKDFKRSFTRRSARTPCCCAGRSRGMPAIAVSWPNGWKRPSE